MRASHLPQRIAPALALAFAAGALHGQQSGEAAPPSVSPPAAPAAPAAASTPATAPDTTAAAGSGAPAADLPGRATFVRACASCHGADGGGAGTVALERPARSFRDGGFSFGNTPEALRRTIAMGIPGTQMPGFGGSLDEAELAAVADFVSSLGPPSAPADARAAEYALAQHPVVAYGILPPVAPDLPVRPRGLLIGTPEGFSFEYRLDDVRLLAVREGGFVERTDWSGRGGTPLHPLGQTVHLEHGGDPPPRVFALAPTAGDPGDPLQGAVPLVCRFTGSWPDIVGGLDYELRMPDGALVARVRESVQGVRTPAGSGFLRSYVVNFTPDAPGPIAVQADDAPPGARVDRFVVAAPPAGGAMRPVGPTTVRVCRRDESGFTCTGVRDFSQGGGRVAPEADLLEAPTGLLVRLTPDTAGKARTHIARVITVLASQWSEELREPLGQGLPP
jgi:mono/diheme cytochrome c family protein